MYEDLRTQAKESPRDHVNDMLEVQTVYDGESHCTSKEKQGGEMKRNQLILNLLLIFGLGIFVGRNGKPDITHEYPITVYAPHTPDTIPGGLTLNGIEVHCFFDEED